VRRSIEFAFRCGMGIGSRPGPFGSDLPDYEEVSEFVVQFQCRTNTQVSEAHAGSARLFVPQSGRVKELRSRPAERPQDSQSSGGICNESLGQREDGKTPADALVSRRRPPSPPGSLRRPQPSARNALPRVAAEVPTTTSSTNTVPPPTLIQSLLQIKCELTDSCPAPSH
jgi:hypothetical protein